MNGPFSRDPGPPPIPQAALQRRGGAPNFPAQPTGPAQQPSSRNLARQRNVMDGFEISIERAKTSLASINHPTRNEDAAIVMGRFGLSAVADGMGGVPAGDVVSHACASLLNPVVLEQQKTVVQTPGHAERIARLEAVFHAPPNKVQHIAPVERAMSDMLLLMNERAELAVQKSAQVRKQAEAYFKEKEGVDFDGNNEMHVKQLERYISTVGTTMSIAKVWTGSDQNHYVTVGNIGDGRKYLRMGGRLFRLTVDHSPLNALIKHGVYDENGEKIESDADDQVDRTIAKEDIVQIAEHDPEVALAVPGLSRTPGDRVPLRGLRNRLSMAIGAGALMKTHGVEFKPYVKTVCLEQAYERVFGRKPQAGETFDIVGASDGVIDNSTERKMEETLNKHGDSPESLTAGLAGEAHEASRGSDGKPDDVTATVLRVTLS